MRKIFIDCGANNGCSVELFKSTYGDWKDYEIHCFEPNEKYTNTLLIYTPHVHTELVWINDEGMSFDGWRGKINNGITMNDTHTVPTIDFAVWMKENFHPSDCIVLKMDIEGAEYEVINRMHELGVLSWVNELYGELHSLKCNLPSTVDEKLLRQLDECGLKMYLWDALEANEVSEHYYTMDFMEKHLYPKWIQRGFKR